MKITKERKVYAAVCGLAALLFVADRLSGSKQAEAAAPAADAAATVVHVAETGPSAAAVQGNVIAARLRDLSKSENLSVETLVDAFRGASGGESAVVVAGFKASHSLGAVMLGRKGASAIINGKCVRVGETLDGYKLNSVSKGVATFVNGSDRVELTLATNVTPDNAIADANK
jgi:hypothetical protein